MRAGKLDRRLTIRRFTVIGRDEFNAPIKDWSDLATVWAQQRPNRGGERFAAQQIAGSSVMTFHIQYRDVKVTDRILYDGREWNITDVREVGRRVVTEIDCVARQD
ncbi:phage head closure protein [Chelativorans oligotrophicus]|uniref:phage head closure protein n=1 Tax=Chelativorans oligotrophicus TaxID=449974 RepID=UPI001407DC83|nr:phage head closure protein [Chelativorans oligotrophicus]